VVCIKLYKRSLVLLSEMTVYISLLVLQMAVGLVLPVPSYIMYTESIQISDIGLMYTL